MIQKDCFRKWLNQKSSKLLIVINNSFKNDKRNEKKRKTHQLLPLFQQNQCQTTTIRHP